MRITPLFAATDEQKESVRGTFWCWVREAHREEHLQRLRWRVSQRISAPPEIVHEHRGDLPCNVDCLLVEAELEDWPDEVKQEHATAKNGAIQAQTFLADRGEPLAPEPAVDVVRVMGDGAIEVRRA